MVVSHKKFRQEKAKALLLGLVDNATDKYKKIWQMTTRNIRKYRRKCDHKWHENEVGYHNFTFGPYIQCVRCKICGKRRKRRRW